MASVQVRDVARLEEENELPQRSTRATACLVVREEARIRATQQRIYIYAVLLLSCVSTQAPQTDQYSAARYCVHAKEREREREDRAVLPTVAPEHEKQART